MINSGNPTALSKLPATLAENPMPAFVTTGNPAQSASDAVVCALKENVSTNKSASLCLARCSSMGALFARQTKINSIVAGSTSARDISLQFVVRYEDGNLVRINRNSNRSNLLVQEIAQ